MAKKINVIVGLGFFIVVIGLMINPLLTSNQFTYNSDYNDTSEGTNNVAIHVIDQNKNIGAMYAPEQISTEETLSLFYCQEFTENINTVAELNSVCDFPNKDYNHYQTWNINYTESYTDELYITVGTQQTNPTISDIFGSKITVDIQNTNYSTVDSTFYMDTNYTYKSHTDWSKDSADGLLFHSPLVIGFILLVVFIIGIIKALDREI